MAATSQEAKSEPEETPSVSLFDGEKPQSILSTLKMLCSSKDDEWVGKKVPMSYKKWSKMNANQRKNIIILWNGFSESYRNKVKGMIGALENPVETSENTTKNDLIRVLHLREWPGAIALWTRALGPMSRLQLDANGSKVHEENDDDVVRMAPWNELAEIFNCRSGDFQPQNMAVDYDDNGLRTRIPRGGHVSAGVVDLLYDLDPNEADRPTRDGAWLKDTWRKLCKEVSVCFERFASSGSQNGDTTTLDGVNEWVFNFAAQFDQAVMYAALICATNTLRTLGKLLPVGGLESGVLTSGEEVTPVAAKRRILQRSENRKRQRAEKKARDAAARRDTEKPRGSPEDPVAAAMVRQSQCDMLMKLVETLPADDPRKSLVVNRMLHLSGVALPPTE